MFNPMFVKPCQHLFVILIAIHYYCELVSKSQTFVRMKSLLPDLLQTIEHYNYAPKENGRRSIGFPNDVVRTTNISSIRLSRLFLGDEQPTIDELTALGSYYNWTIEDMIDTSIPRNVIPVVRRWTQKAKVPASNS